MATAQEIRAEIAAERQRLAEQQQLYEEAAAQKKEAVERQKLRRELDDIRRSRQSLESCKSHMKCVRQLIDRDQAGPCMPGELLKEVSYQPKEEDCCACSKDEMRISCNDHICTGEYVWEIEGMSWLSHTLAHYGEVAESHQFEVKSTYLDEFQFVYHPNGGVIRAYWEINGGKYLSEPYSASLAIRYTGDSRGDDTGSTFRYKVLIQRNDGEFVQWGPQGDFHDLDQDKTQMLFGPDVHRGPGPANGIFGLTHEALLQSEWVHNDTLTVKFELEVRQLDHDPEVLPLKKVKVEVPPSSLSSNFLTLLEEGKGSDVTIAVKGDTFKAHSQVLMARSEVFEKQFQSGMSESLSREVVVDDCEPGAFKIFLQFLYTDDFAHIETRMKSCKEIVGGSEGGSDVDNSSASSPPQSKASFLQDVFALSHKYAVTRLSRWCEQQLCDLISEANVCEVFIQAHLCEAGGLEEACLAYIKGNLQKVAAMPSFADLSSKWPELMMKMSLFTSGLSSSAAASAVAAHQDVLRKRKRE